LFYGNIEWLIGSHTSRKILPLQKTPHKIMTNNEIYYTRGCKVFHGSMGETLWRQCKGCHQLAATDCHCNAHNAALPNDIVQIRFKHTRKEFFKTGQTLVHAGDAVIVESPTKYDLGIVTLTGDMAYKLMLHNGLDPQTYEYKMVLRKAKAAEIERWCDAVEQERPLMIRARSIAASLGLNMKIGDVEMYGDGAKAIFYYIADDRVDFRQLIKVMAEEFRIRIEMKQIGARQEAGRIGGLGICGREVCCSTFLSKFVTVPPTAPRDMEYASNAIKLTGQCGKLKCCFNYEYAAYIDARKDFPPVESIAMLQTADGDAHYIKTDVFRRIMWYHYRDRPDEMIAVSVERAAQVRSLNLRGVIPAALVEDIAPAQPPKHDYNNASQDNDITRFDNKELRTNKNKERRRRSKERKKGH
jgi:cell fate regulator YaaT (PSP1 superfamily)